MFTHKTITEEEVINLLIKDLIRTPESLVSFFSILFRTSANFSADYSGVYFAKMVQRKEVGLERQGKPGDFDILLIPYKDKHIFFERTAVFEVKVLRPSIKNPKRNANSLGTTQINGLIEDGFPLIGLIHICMTEPLPEKDCLEVKHFKRPVNLEGSQSRYSSDDYEIVKVDPFPLSAAENQKRRLISFNLPTFVDLYSSSISFNQNGGWTMIENFTVDLGERGDFNPKTKVETIKKIKDHFDYYSDSKYTKIEFARA